MRSPRTNHLAILAAAAALALGLAPASALARFGTSGGGHSSGGHSSGGASVHGAVPVPRAAPRPYAGGSGYSGYYRGGYDGVYYLYGASYPYGYTPWYVRYGWGFGYYPLLGAPLVTEPIPEAGYAQPEPPAPPVVTSLGLQAQSVLGGGGALGLHAGLEGEHWGFMAETNSFLLPSLNPGASTYDAVHMLYLHGSYALLSGPNGRLRAEAGVDSAFAPNYMAVGPGLGLSGAVGLLGPLSLEGAAHFTPFPFTQFDWSAGAALALGPVGVRAGWRRTFLDDHGVAGGSSVFSGPYVGLGLAL